MSAADESMAELAGRLEGVVEELTDMALDALRRATSGDPDAAEAGEALAVERRIVRARRSVEKAVAILAPSSGPFLDDGAG
ncbi:MAG TPA: hypothetical protein VG298_08865 [Acidimicrobiales bacterium]|nr:hypothetical protein [Acidimicrobiales bacterium]